MAMTIVEQDFGTKAATAQVLERMHRQHPRYFDMALWGWWKKVYLDAIKYVPVDTGALRHSIRIQRGRQPQGPFNTGAGLGRINGKDLDEYATEFYILAGGMGVINPKKETEVDYAQAVHDGYVSGGSWHQGRPFLTQAIEKNIGTLSTDMEKYLNWYEENWQSDQPIPSPYMYQLPTKIKTYINGVMRFT